MALARPTRHLSPAWGKRVGRREREVVFGPRAGVTLSTEAENVAVKGIPVRGKPAPFAGRRWNMSLGRSMSSAGVSSLVDARTGDNGCPEDAEEGNVVACDLSRRTHRTVRVT
jgi:hypothetical protein